MWERQGIVGVRKTVTDVRNFGRDKELWEKPKNHGRKWKNVGKTGICGREWGIIGQNGEMWKR